MACKGCERQEQLLNTDIDQLIEQQLSLEINLINENDWKKRQLICEKCPFRNEHTCTKCGCFYKFRSALSTKECPMKYWEAL